MVAHDFSDIRAFDKAPAATGIAAKAGSYRLWVGIGLLFLTAQIVTIGRWISSPLFRPSPVGADPLPAGMLGQIRTMEAANTILVFVLLWFFILRPLLRRGELTVDGKISIAMGTCFWLDTLYNYTNIVWYYNAYAINMGSWLSFIPGQSAIGQEMFPEPVVSSILLWFTSFSAFAWVASKFYRKLLTWFEGRSLFLPIAGLYFFCAFLDCIFENTYIRSGTFGFAGVWSPMTLWAGTVYQYPLYECLMWSVLVTSLTLFRHYAIAGGEGICERGLATANVSRPMKNFLGALAVIGFCQSLALFAWMMPYQWFATHIDTFAALPSYDRAGMCGNGTPYACPDGSFGVPTRDMAPNLIVRPDDPRLSPAAKRAQGL